MLSTYFGTVILGLAGSAFFVIGSAEPRAPRARIWFWATSAVWWAAAAWSIVRVLTIDQFLFAGMMFAFGAAIQGLMGVLLNPPLFTRIYQATRGLRHR